MLKKSLDKDTMRIQDTIPFLANVVKMGSRNQVWEFVVKNYETFSDRYVCFSVNVQCSILTIVWVVVVKSRYSIPTRSHILDFFNTDLWYIFTIRVECHRWMKLDEN